MVFDFITLSIIDASTLFQWVVDNASYWLVFILMVVESSFIPFPSEVVVPPAAYLACTNDDLNVVGVTLVATAGAIVGALINYYLSLWIGRPIVYKFANSRLGHALLINEEKVENAERYFDRHGAISTFIGRLIPAVRQLISIPAGLARMNIWMFILFTGLGALVWNSVLAALGYWLGKTVPLADLFTAVEQYNDYLTYAGLAIGAVCVCIIAYNAFRPRKQTI
ncbi:MAG: DedA family protein [Bacteroidales bacterium]|nr:DedA family protein [Bacteroidales bacterium]